MDIRGAHVLYVMGKRRSGKSYTLGALAEGLVSNAWIKQGSFDQGVVILDTMNVFLTMPFPVGETEGRFEPCNERTRPLAHTIRTGAVNSICAGRCTSASRTDQRNYLSPRI